MVITSNENMNIEDAMDSVPHPEDYRAGCWQLDCQCDVPHPFTPNKDGFCTWCGLDDLNLVEAHNPPSVNEGGSNAKPE